MKTIHDVQVALAALLQTIDRHGDFFTSDTAQISPPNLTVEGVGLLSLPFQQSQLAPLLAQAQLAPFGRGTETLIDTAVRCTWQVDASALAFGGSRWQASLDAIVARAADGLGVAEPVHAELYKLLVYDTGSFFVEHRDTEKSAGMFATLVLVLPSVYSGGELLVHHRDRTVRLDLATEPGDAAFAAFYADCVHEVLPVTSGARLALVYNLVRNSGTGPLTAPEYDHDVRSAAGLLRDWMENLDDVPAKLVYPLEHAYSLAELDFATLKNVDAAVARTLIAAAAQADCEVHLALLDIEESGNAEGGYYGDEDSADYDIDSVENYDANLSAWRASDGSIVPLGALPVEYEELCPPDVFDDAEPDESHFHEATGNEGATFERAYRRASLVVWPRARRVTIIGTAPLAASLPYLEHVVAAGVPPESKQWREACKLAELMQIGWPSVHMHDGAQAARYLASVISLRDSALIDTYLKRIAGSGHLGGDEATVAAEAALLLSSPRAASLIATIVAANVRFVPGACATLVGAAWSAGIAVPAAAQHLVDALLGRETPPPEHDYQRAPGNIGASVLVATLEALHRAAMPAQADELVQHWLATCQLDDVLVPAALAVVNAGASAHLRAQVLRRIDERIALPLAPPSDLRRDSALSCSCQYCAQLAQFLADSRLQRWTLKAAERHRQHMARTIVADRCDVDCETVRVGSPHGLACTKNQASYQARCRQRVTDLALHEALAA